jgi:4-hydroxy-tetrahydrodipicolinate synthase
MAIPFRPERLLVPVITPFDEAGRVDEGSLERHAEDVLAAGAAGLVAVATTGEATALDAEERALVISVCARVCATRDAVLIVGAGTYNTRETIARHEALADVPAVRASLAVVPYYVRPSEAAIVGHFQAVAERSPVPLIVYNIPYRTGRGLGSYALLELARTENIVGVKRLSAASTPTRCRFLPTRRRASASWVATTLSCSRSSSWAALVRSRPRRTSPRTAMQR